MAGCTAVWLKDTQNSTLQDSEFNLAVDRDVWAPVNPGEDNGIIIDDPGQLVIIDL